MPYPHALHPARFAVGPSRRLQYALSAGHGLAMIACLISALPWPGKLLLSLVLPVHFYFAAREAGSRQVAIGYLEGSGWAIDDEPVAILPSSVLTPFAIWLHYEPRSTRKKALLIVKDAMPDAEFRRLTVKLKISAA
ncbi:MULTISPECIES: protein YgfX [Methylomicrobium]|uniref:Toxin CptA n=1 Tax=Methylomicrobium album BG8 TaxID=686340 RepID=H8GQU4_METAL|nr:MULTISPECIES: protein YgfX [Methylomicrobium]EIC31079.1 hypothetical protein Metal_3427 [Methylomicrobium album BG8]